MLLISIDYFVGRFIISGRGDGKGGGGGDRKDRLSSEIIEDFDCHGGWGVAFAKKKELSPFGVVIERN